MSSVLSIIESPELLFSNIVLLLPGILAFLVFRSLNDYRDKKLRGFDIIALLVFSLLMVLISPVIDFSSSTGLLAYYLIIPISLGFISDFLFRSWMVYIVLGHKNKLLRNLTKIPLVGGELSPLAFYDTSDISRWLKILRENTDEKDYNNWKYIEVETEQGMHEGFLVGYSENDIELVKWKQVPRDIFGYETDKDELVRVSTVIMKEDIVSIEVFNYNLSNLELN